MITRGGCDPKVRIEWVRVGGGHGRQKLSDMIFERSLRGWRRVRVWDWMSAEFHIDLYNTTKWITVNQLSL